MKSLAYMLFDTALGRCGLAWGADGILAVSFAHEYDEQTRAQLKCRAHGVEETTTVPGEIAHIIDEIRALFTEGVCDLSDVCLDMMGLSEFDRDLYKFTREIKPGETKTYGDLAKALGNVSFSRRVGQSLGRNPFPIIVPCQIGRASCRERV